MPLKVYPAWRGLQVADVFSEELLAKLSMSQISLFREHGSKARIVSATYNLSDDITASMIVGPAVSATRPSFPSHLSTSEQPDLAEKV